MENIIVYLDTFSVFLYENKNNYFEEIVLKIFEEKKLLEICLEFFDIKYSLLFEKVVSILNLIIGKEDQIDNYFIKNNIISLLKNLLLKENLFLLENTLSLLGKLVYKKKHIRELFIQKNIITEILIIIEKVDIYYKGNFEIYFSFINFLYYYYSTVPYLSYTEMKKFIFFVINFYIYNNSLDIKIQKRLLKLIHIISLLNTKENDENFITKENFSIFINKLTPNISFDNPLNVYSLKIFNNFLYYNEDVSSPYDHEIIITPLFFYLLETNLKQEVENNDIFHLQFKILKNLLNHKTNFSLIVEQTNIINTIIDLLKSTNDEDLIIESLLCLSLFFKNKFQNQTVYHYVLKNEDIVDIILSFLDNKRSKNFMMLLAEILHNILLMGEIEGEDNPFVIRILNIQFLTQKLEDSLKNKNIEVKKRFFGIAQRFFEFESVF